MSGITHKLTHLLDPGHKSSSRSSSPSRQQPVHSDDSGSIMSTDTGTAPPEVALKRKATKSDKPFLTRMLGPLSHLQISKSCHSNIASSGELFGVFKALAADINDLEEMVLDGELDTPTTSSRDSQEHLQTPDEARTLSRLDTNLASKSGDREDTETTHLIESPEQLNALAAQLTALSVNNMSPLATADHVAPDALDTATLASESGETLRDPTVANLPQVSDEEKLKAIQDEFGVVSDIMVDKDTGESVPEKMLAEAKGSFFREVMMIGHLHLTNYRLLFHALLPPNTNEFPNGEPHVVMSGPVTFHYASPLKPARRVWMEVGPEMITTYPRGDESGRVRPLRCILLSSIRRMEPLKPDQACDFWITYESPQGNSSVHFTVDTEQSALQWRRKLEGALFRNAKKIFWQNAGSNVEDRDSWLMMRCCVPLDRVSLSGISEYHSFATLVSLNIAWQEDGITPHWLSEQLSLGDPLWSDSPVTSGYNTPISDPSMARAVTLPVSPSPKPPSNRSPLSSDSDKPKSPIPSPLPKDLVDEKKAKRNSSTLASLLPRRTASGSGTHTPPRSDSPHRRKDTQWLNTTLPPILARAKESGMNNPSEVATFGNEFKVVVLNEVSWFVQALFHAVEASRDRQYKPGVKQPRLRIEVGGHDCLATDEEIEVQEPLQETLSRNSIDLDELATDSVESMRKAEVVALAAKVFGFESDTHVWIKRGYLAQPMMMMPARGHVLITKDFFCFWRRAAIGGDIKYRYAVKDIKGADVSDADHSAFHGMALHIHGQKDLKFEFWQRKARDEVVARVHKMCQQYAESIAAAPPRPHTPSTASSMSRSTSTDTTPPSELGTSSGTATVRPSIIDMPTREFLRDERGKQHAADILALPKDALFQSKTFPDEVLPYVPFIANQVGEMRVRLAPRHFVCLTIGSRGDVQPYIALALRLKADGHTVTIVTHDEFKSWIESYGIAHRQTGGDPTALMKLSAEHKMFSPGFFKETLSSFRTWLDNLLLDSWTACHDADVLIESPSTFAGIHIAEALQIPYFRAFTMPWTRTNAYPQAFMVPPFEMGPSFNYSTYVMFDNIIWRAMAGQVNRWRKVHLGLKATNMSTLSTSQVPFLYNFSSAVVPKPLDWHDNITITGYWNLENSDAEWSAPQALEDFIAKAKSDGKPLVYIGFGSIVVPNPNHITKSIIRGVEKADVRAIIAKGWSSRGADPAKEGSDIEFPDSCFGLEKVPHGWLFPRIDAAMHHGGAGTVGASLRAGLPTIIKPWFGDQFFWALRVTKLGVGIKLNSLKSDDIAQALKEATSSKVMIEKAARTGRAIRSENGVDNAVEAIQFYISRAAADRRQMHWQKT